MTIIDGHAHVFPYLGGACGYKSIAEHMAVLQSEVLGNVQVEAKYSGAGMEEVLLGELPDVNFRVGRFGRFEWNEGGVDYYRQHTPPTLQDHTASPELMIAQMDHA
ncbi:unnamed protein product, partial [marine sediment metagenome]